MKFPFQAKLISVPDSAYAASHMTVGQVYTVYSWAGSCFVVSTNTSGDKTMIHHKRMEKVVLAPV